PARAAVERDPPRDPGAAEAPEPHLPRDGERQPDRVREARARERRRRVREPRPVRRARGDRDRSGFARPPTRVRGSRPAERRDPRLADRPELRRPRPRQEPRPEGRALNAEAMDNQPGHWFESDPLWFKRAIFYEIHVRGFFDGNDDGSGDLRGLQDKLDYLQWLGIDCIWLLPIYPSPLRDGGYDIADFNGVHPDYGNVEDFRSLIEAAHQRGIRVIADLVMNHTSADHPWFQESRAGPDSPKRD